MFKPAPEKEYISVTVHNPTIHNTYEEGRYTTFDVELQTNSLSFTTKHYVVQRRYSDFQWLRKALAKTTGGSPPSLPFGRIFGTFDENFLNERQKILTDFMQKIVRDTLFVSSSALHLFLQTGLSRKDMETVIKESKRRGSMNAVARAISMYGNRSNRIRSRHSVACLSGTGTSFYDHNSSKSVPHFGSLISGLEAMSTSGSSESDLSTCTYNDSSSVSDSRVSSDFRAGRNSLVGSGLNYTEQDNGEWVVIESSPSAEISPAASLNSLNHSNIRPNPISSEDYTKVSWSIGDCPKSSEKIGMKAKTRNSIHISVPMNQRLKTLQDVPPLTAHSLGSVTHRRSCDQFRTDSVSFRTGDEMRRVASESNVVDKYLSSPPLPGTLNLDKSQKVISPPQHSTPKPKSSLPKNEISEDMRNVLLGNFNPEQAEMEAAKSAENAQNIHISSSSAQSVGNVEDQSESKQFNKLQNSKSKSEPKMDKKQENFSQDLSQNIEKDEVHIAEEKRDKNIVDNPSMSQSSTLSSESDNSEKIAKSCERKEVAEIVEKSVEVAKRFKQTVETTEPIARTSVVVNVKSPKTIQASEDIQNILLTKSPSEENQVASPCVVRKLDENSNEKLIIKNEDTARPQTEDFNQDEKSTDQNTETKLPLTSDTA